MFRDTTPSRDIDRAKGLRLLARNVSLALQFNLENNDPDFPELLHYFDPLRKQGGDNTDALYVGAPINGEHTYRISGHRGSLRRGEGEQDGDEEGGLGAEDIQCGHGVFSAR